MVTRALEKNILTSSKNAIYKSDTNGINWFLSIYAFFPSMLVVIVEYHIINSLQA